jgi:DNA adenine methylase
MFPSHKVYVEPFFGGGAVFFGKTPSEVEVVNDLDSKLIEDYRRILKAPVDPKAYTILKSEKKQNDFLDQPGKSIADRVYESILRRCNGFGGTYVKKSGVYTDDRPHRLYKVTTHEAKIKNMGEYKKRLGNATLLTQDYRKVIQKYDSDETFFFLDPPYEMSEGIGYAKGSEDFDFERLADTLRGIKGSFLMTINDSPSIRKAFHGFKLRPYIVKGHHSVTSGVGSKDRPELFISNYNLPRKQMLNGGVKLGKAEARYNRALNKWNTLTEKPSATQKELQKAWNELSLAEVDYQNAFQGITSEAAQELGQDLEAQQELIKRPEPTRQRAMTQREIEIEDAIQRRRNEERADEERLEERERNARWREQMRELEAQFEERRRREQLGDGSGSGKPSVPKGYLTEAKRKAKAAGYEPSRLKLCNRGTNKLMYETPEGKVVHFGSAEHGDHIIWSKLEKKGDVPPGTAETKRRVFRTSHEAMKGSWKTNPYSANALALAILW